MFIFCLFMLIIFTGKCGIEPIYTNVVSTAPWVWSVCLSGNIHWMYILESDGSMKAMKQCPINELLLFMEPQRLNDSAASFGPVKFYRLFRSLFWFPRMQLLCFTSLTAFKVLIPVKKIINKALQLTTNKALCLVLVIMMISPQIIHLQRECWWNTSLKLNYRPLKQMKLLFWWKVDCCVRQMLDFQHSLCPTTQNHLERCRAPGDWSRIRITILSNIMAKRQPGNEILTHVCLVWLFDLCKPGMWHRTNSFP